MQSLLIAVPTMGGVMKAATADTLVRLIKTLTKLGIEADYSNIDSSDIVLARNIYANSMLETDKWDGLLFIDSDMSFLPRLVVRMLKLNVDAVAVAYQKRGFDWERFAGILKEHGDLERARAASSEFVLRPSWQGAGSFVTKRRGGFVTMAACGLGCSLISRSALQAMVDSKVVTARKDGSKKDLWGFFDHVEVDGHAYAEDYSFWYRWTKLMERDLWVCIDEAISHVGQFAYQGRYLALRGPTRAAGGSSLAPDSVKATG